MSRWIDIPIPPFTEPKTRHRWSGKRCTKCGCVRNAVCFVGRNILWSYRLNGIRYTGFTPNCTNTMQQEYYEFQKHPSVIKHIGGVLEIPEHISTADIPVSYWCESLGCKYAEKLAGSVSPTCPKCGKDTVCPLPF